MSGCDRELNAHFYSAASLKYHVPDTWHDTTPSHIILTLGRPVLALPRKSECQARSSYYHFLTTLVCRGPGSNPWLPVPRNGHSTNWAIGAGLWSSDKAVCPKLTTQHFLMILNNHLKCADWLKMTLSIMCILISRFARYMWFHERRLACWTSNTDIQTCRCRSD